MSITFPKTWTTEALNASDVNANLDAMLIKQQKLASTDLNMGNKFFDTKHIVRGDYNTVTNVVENVSGVFGGQHSGGMYSKSSFMTRWMSGVDNLDDHILPLTSFTVDFYRPCNIFFQWWMCIQSDQDDYNAGSSGTGSMQFYVKSDEGNITPLGMQHLANEFPSTVAGTDIYSYGTYQSNGFHMIENSGELLQYGLGLAGHSSCGKNEAISWGVSLEAFYI